MKSFNKIFITFILLLMLIFVSVNIYFACFDTTTNEGRPYRVEINRLALLLETSSFESIKLDECDFVTNITVFSRDNIEFYENTDSDYIIKEIDGKLYRFDYSRHLDTKNIHLIIVVNIILGIMSIITLSTMIYLRRKILIPFETLREVPYELSKGNLTVPMKENRNRFFGRFVWGVDLLRENIEHQKQRELSLQKDKKTLLLSISHDIKTPLSAIKLYSKALSKNLYKEKDKQLEIAESINEKADEIEGFVSQIIKASSEDFLNLEVNKDEFYLSHLIEKLSLYYQDKLALIKTDFHIENYIDCILNGDIERSIEVLQNIIENATKYGDGHSIEIIFSDEENCKLITIKNSGSSLPETELPHIFDSFWRGSNAEQANGSGLGLYICRQLMQKMNGEIFAQVENNYMLITTVFRKAG